MPDLIICNTSPLFYLHRLRLLDLLQKLYGRITVPEGVLAELEAGRHQGEDVPNLAEHPWIEVRSVRVPEVIVLVTDFGPGEAEVLSLGLEHPGSLVILDDRLARTVAAARGLRLTGTAGVLLKASQQGHLSVLAPVLEQLTQLGFRLAPAVARAILQLAGE
jgi:hypothetical protein